jgi:GNAT superfamily N-acetyltransferase
MGFYIVKPELRGTGIGKRLYDAIVARLGDVTLGGDAVPQQVANYESEGFEVAYWNARYSSSELPRERAAATRRPTATHLLPATAADFERLVEFDGAHCFGPRPEFLQLWIEGPDRESRIAVDDSGRITGFAASRRTSLGQRIGPVFAEESATAEPLILSLAARTEGRVAVDVPQPNLAAVELLEGLGMTRSFETARIYRGPAPELPLDRIFGITSLELG